MLQINIYKNTELSNIQFPANAVVLISDKTDRNGNRTIQVLPFEGVPDTRDTTIVKHTLKAMLAEFFVTTDFAEKFGWFETGATIKDANGKTSKEYVKTGIKQNRKFLPFLKTNTIFKTDKDGKLSQAVICDNGLTLLDTALNIKEEQLATLYEYNTKQFRSALQHTAQAVLAQCSFFSKVEQELININNGLVELANKEQEEIKKQQEQEKKKEEKKQEKKVS